MHFSEVGEEEGATKEREVHRENGKITGGRKKKQLLPEKLEHEAGSGKGNGIQHVSSENAMANFHPSYWMSYLQLKFTFKADPALPPSFFHSL